METQKEILEFPLFLPLVCLISQGWTFKMFLSFLNWEATKSLSALDVNLYDVEKASINFRVLWSSFSYMTVRVGYCIVLYAKKSFSNCSFMAVILKACPIEDSYPALFFDHLWRYRWASSLGRSFPQMRTSYHIPEKPQDLFLFLLIFLFA